MTYETLLTSANDGVLTITINRPDKLNALNRQVFTDIGDCIKAFHEDDSLKVAIMTGAGEKAFVAGADISEFGGLNAEEGKTLAARGQVIFNSIERGPKPVIAAVNGFALGGGCELTMACHMRVASETARFGQPEVNLGLIPGYGGTQRLVQLIGKGKALELLMTADMIKAPEALALGLVNHVVPAEELLSTSEAIARKIMTKAPIAVAKCIASVNAYFEDGVNGLEYEIDQFGECCTTEDFVEGAAAFMEKRAANFQGK